MDFDEIEYLEKTVEEAEDRDGSKKKSSKSSKEASERSYRKREAEDDYIDNEDERKERKRSRGRDEEENGDKSRRDKDKDRDRHRRDKERDRERERDRDSERERSSRERDRERDKSREREKEKEKERSSKERDRDRERKEREREREKERERRERREKEKEKEREEEKDRRERSMSRSRRHESDREREKEKEREREPEFETRDNRRFKDKKEAVEPEADPERDQRTVFAYQMPLKASERDAYEFFSKAGKVRDVRLIMDRNSRRSKGVGYIEFYDAMSVPMAIALSGQLLLGQPVMVKPSEAEKNLVQSTASGASTGGVAGQYGPVDRKLYVGNLHFNMTELHLRKLFEPFGTVELVQLPLDLETGQCKGFGFVQFAQLESAKAAQTALNGKLEIAGRFIKVSSVTEHGGQQDTSTKSADFDDDDGGGLSLNAQSRALLMQKLDRTGIATSIAGSLGVPPLLNGTAPNLQAISLPMNGQAAIGAPVLPGHILPPAASESIGQPSECLHLKNLFDPATETEPDFDLDIKEDVEEECSKYGHVKHIYVEKNSAGYVYLRFDTVESAGKAQRAMHLRWFARRSISAIFMQPHEYRAKFPDAF